jgi:2-hydroxycyclohexanecarboxyl-CoA dehydrogenase
MSNDLEMQGRVALVAGGSKGIGRAAALRLAALGADVAVVSRGENGKAVAEEVKSMGRRAVAIQADLSDVDECAAMAKQALSALGRIDVLVVSGSQDREDVAGRPFIDTDPHDYPAFLTSQLLTKLNPIGAVLPSMREQGYGKVVVLTTDAGRVPTVSSALFGAAAAGLQFGVRAIGKEVARFGIRVNAVSITVTKGTAIWDNYLEGQAPGENLVKAYKRIEDMTPFHMNTPEDVANAVCFFASPISDQISGATLSVNGGASFP